jgi:outer membrane receptor protein involved in Fe transport
MGDVRVTRSTRIRAAIISALVACAPAQGVAKDDPARVSTFPAEYFASMQPYSAFDMLSLTPGFTFAESDPDVRGFGGAVGNVLIDGARPAAKQEALETTLRRIPASAVERIEVIRSGAPGVDMQGHSMVANVVRVRAAKSAGAIELGSTFYRDFYAPRAAGEWSSETEARRLEVSGAAYAQTGDEHGAGGQTRSLDDVVVSDALYALDEHERVIELAAALEERLPEGGALRANAAFARERSRAAALESQFFPAPEDESDLEREQQTEAEVGVHYEAASRSGMQLDWLGLYRRTREDEREDSADAADQSSFEQRQDASEAIVRGRVRSRVARAAVEAGLEAARNVLEGRSALEENGAPVELPAADVRVEEQRMEAFALSNLQLASDWALEAGARLEYSVLEQSGDSSVRKSFFFPKPRVLVSHAASDASQWRMLVEGRVGQLDFEDFVTSTSLSANTVSAGNPDLEPERSWVVELAWERKWGESASFLAAARREWISNLVDRTPVLVDGALLDGVGNIGEGVRDELEMSFSLPLRTAWLESARLKGAGVWRRSEATDPTTGEQRAISEDLPFEASVSFTQDLTSLSLHWGVAVEFGEEATQFMIDEVRAERVGTQVDVFVEYTPTPAWNLRFAAENLTDRSLDRERWIYDGARSDGPLEYVETRTLRMGPYYSVRVRRSF